MSEDRPPTDKDDLMTLDWPADPPALTDGVVGVRPWRDTDAATVHRACQDAEIQRWTRVPVPYTRDDANTYVGRLWREVWEARTGALFAAVDASTDNVLGAIGLVTVDLENLVGEVGDRIAPWARQRGVAGRAARLLCHWALGEGGLARIELHVDPENRPSRAVAEGLGCELEGILRSRVIQRGHRRDLALYALVNAPGRRERAADS